MTDSEMDAIDQRIAVEIMGWIEHHSISTKWEQLHNQKDGSYMQMNKDLWKPTRRIEQAWQTWEKTGLHLQLNCIRKSINGDLYNARMFGYKDGLAETIAEESCETAPLAISLAALKTLEKK